MDRSKTIVVIMRDFNITLRWEADSLSNVRMTVKGVNCTGITTSDAGKLVKTILSQTASPSKICLPLPEAGNGVHFP